MLYTVLYTCNSLKYLISSEKCHSFGILKEAHWRLSGRLCITSVKRCKVRFTVTKDLYPLMGKSLVVRLFDPLFPNLPSFPIFSGLAERQGNSLTRLKIRLLLFFFTIQRSGLFLNMTRFSNITFFPKHLKDDIFIIKLSPGSLSPIWQICQILHQVPKPELRMFLI